jgi:7-cyano-7-deazaguanine synthase
MRKVVIGLSGGMDSATLLALLLEQGMEVHCCTFYYGSKHNKYETKAAEYIIEWYEYLKLPVVHHPIDVSGVFTEFSSNLLLTGGDIPEGHYEAENMKLTVIPGRNLIFGAIMAGIAESIGAEFIALGVHQGDHAIYPDCRPEFIQSMSDTIHLSSDGKVSVQCPLLSLNKTGVLSRGLNLHAPYTVPYELTRTCYKDQEYACGKCGSCQERIEAFTNIGTLDPITYV